MKQFRFSHRAVEYIPELLEEGVLYVSYRYGTAVHACACGCGEEVVTPLNPTDWTLLIKNGSPTLSPSIGNWSFACSSHYFIRDGAVVWAGGMSHRQIELGRKRDRAARERYLKTGNRRRAPLRSSMHRLLDALRRWWRST